MKVEISTGEHYPHTFVSNDVSDVAYREQQGDRPGAALIEITDAEWAGFWQAQKTYQDWLALFRERAGIKG